MGLSSALFAGSSGLNTLGNAMQIIGDNISNINTYGFKKSQYTFQNLFSQTVSTMSGPSQVGCGSSLGDISTSFEQGSFETTSSPTDLGISGDGFFRLREKSSQSIYYSRAGNFRFDKDGYMTNPEGYVVQGYEFDAAGNETGTAADIKLDSFTAPPQATEKISTILNIDAGSNDNSSGADDALATAWDGTATTPLADTAYAYQTSVQVYDSLGSTHDITLYFDKADTASATEFLVTCNPGEDKRVGADPVDPTADAHAGLLARGLLEFDASTGAISDIDMWQIDGDGAKKALDEKADLTDGYFTFNADFIGNNAMNVKLDFGATSDGSHIDTSWTNDSLSTTQYAAASNISFKSNDGYATGDLQDINVDVDGVITGTFSNGQITSLYRIALSDFQNNLELQKKGGNLYEETLESGNAITNKPGTKGLGNIASNSLEQSNVDISAEFVKMITTQRGFQANSKIITVTDEMLGQLINIKR